MGKYTLSKGRKNLFLLEVGLGVQESKQEVTKLVSFVKNGILPVSCNMEKWTLSHVTKERPDQSAHLHSLISGYYRLNG